MANRVAAPLPALCRRRRFGAELLRRGVESGANMSGNHGRAAKKALYSNGFIVP
ncbi:MAG TPA: hypothetical protein PLI43_10015 [Albidovulum sp.]|uniref:hypothetical protein n=1 Tax=Albidovulum sp. TaxID=1872424 RepID=UPI002C6B3DCB|nr:hypothetical protein [Albidovulum sp.]